MRSATATLAVLVGLSTAGTAATIHVPGDQPTIQAGINAASTGDTVLLVDGTFSGPGNEEIVFMGRAITVCSQSGDPATCIIDVTSEYTSGFEFLHGEGPSSVLAGVTITNAYSGIKCRNASSPLIVNCVFTDNRASNGGGISCQSYASPAIVGCSFIGNVATDDNLGGGGGISCYGGCGPTIENCEFVGNSAPGSYGGGGAIFVRSSPFPGITGCTFDGNWAGTGGAIQAHEDGITPESCISGCVFTGNWCVKWGGALRLGDVGPLSIDDCSFVENYTLDGGLTSRGGAAYLSSNATAVFNACSFSRNQAHYQGGAIATQAGAVVEALGCTFDDNGAGVGGAIEASGSECVLTNCTFSGHTADAGGTAYFTMGSTAAVDGCTIDGSGAPSNGGGFCCNGSDVLFSNTIVAFGTDGPAIYCREGGTATLVCCDIYGNAGGDWTYPIADQLGLNGNICEDPLYCGAQTPMTPYALHVDSPCAPDSNPDCGLIGAWEAACPATALTERSWGHIKAMFR